jgi:hypothetical protein
MRPARWYRSTFRSAMNRSGFKAARPSSAATAAASVASGNHEPRRRTPAARTARNTAPNHSSHADTSKRSRVKPYACW